MGAQETSSALIASIACIAYCVAMRRPRFSLLGVGLLAGLTPRTSAAGTFVTQLRNATLAALVAQPKQSWPRAKLSDRDPAQATIGSCSSKKAINTATMPKPKIAIVYYSMYAREPVAWETPIALGGAAHNARRSRRRRASRRRRLPR